MGFPCRLVKSCVVVASSPGGLLTLFVRKSDFSFTMLLLPAVRYIRGSVSFPSSLSFRLFRTRGGEREGEGDERRNAEYRTYTPTHLRRRTYTFNMHAVFFRVAWPKEFIAAVFLP